jgi:branched-chain amino acid transport system permease protein
MLTGSAGSSAAEQPPPRRPLSAAMLRPIWFPLFVAVVLAVAAVGVPVVFSEFWVGLITLGLVYGLFAFGLDLAWGRTGVVSIGQAVFFGSGAYGIAIANQRGGSLALGAVLGIVFAVALAVLIGAAGLRTGATLSTMAVLTLAVTLLAAQIATSWVSLTGGTNGLLVLTSASPTAYFWECIAVTVAVVGACQLFVFRARIGNRLVAVRLNPRRAQHLGIDVFRHGLFGFGLAAAISAVAGALAAPIIGLISPEVVGVALSTQVLIWVALGGRNTLLGPFVGAMLATVGQNLLSGASVDYYLLALGVLLVVVVTVVPDGLVGTWRRTLEIRPAWSLRRRSPAARGAEPAGEAPGTPAPDTLVATGTVKRFGAISALAGVDLAVRPGEIVCLVGPNGAGKTTLLNVISGDLRGSEGRVEVLGRDVTRMAVHRRSRLGVARTFQVPSLFAELTVAEQLTLSRQEAGREVSLSASYAGLESALADRRARDLSLGERRYLEIAIALAHHPRVLLLDEPAAGLARAEAAGLALDILATRDQLGCSVVAVEHDMEIVRLLADRVVVLHRGQVLAEGSIDEISGDAQVRDAYLGVS